MIGSSRTRICRRATSRAPIGTGWRIGHQLRCVGEAAQVAKLSDHGHGCDQVDAAPGHGGIGNDKHESRLGQVAPRKQGQTARALEGRSVPFALFLGVLCAVPAALVGVLLAVIRL